MPPRCARRTAPHSQKIHQIQHCRPEFPGVCWEYVSPKPHTQLPPTPLAQEEAKSRFWEDTVKQDRHCSSRYLLQTNHMHVQTNARTTLPTHGVVSCAMEFSRFSLPIKEIAAHHTCTVQPTQRRRWPHADPSTQNFPAGERLQPHAAVYDFDCSRCDKRCQPEPRQGICSRCITQSQARAGMVMANLESVVMLMLQRAVCKAGPLPAKGLVGHAAPIDRRMFFALHRMLVCQLPVPRAGQGISMDRLGNPQMIAGMQTPMLNGKFGFDVTLIEVVAAVVSERSWVQRAAAPLVAGGRIPDTVLVHCGPVIHHPCGAIGCIATPLTFEWEANAPFHGVRADRALVKHDYFILDTGGGWAGMGKTSKRTQEEALLNRSNLCLHANRLRSRGASFTAAQESVIDAYLQAMGADDVASEDEDDEAGEVMQSPGGAARAGRD